MVKMTRIWLISCPPDTEGAFEAIERRLAGEPLRQVFSSERPLAQRLAAELAQRHRARFRSRRRLGLAPGETGPSAGRQFDAVIAEMDDIVRMTGPRTSAAVVEAPVARLVLCHLFGLPKTQSHQIGQDPGAVNLLLNERGLWMVDSANDTGHISSSFAIPPKERAAAG